MIDKFRLDDLRLESGEKGELARWVIQLQTDLDYERRKISTPPAPVVQQEPIAWLNDAYLGRGVVDGEAGSEDAGPGYIPVYRESVAIPPALVVPDEWISCSEQDPEEPGSYLAIDDNGVVWTAIFDMEGLTPDVAGYSGIVFTHWMPLPAAPQQEVK